MQEQELKEKLGKNIKFFRFRKQLSQADLAEKVQISITSLSDIERETIFHKLKHYVTLPKPLMSKFGRFLEVKVRQMIKKQYLSIFQRTFPNI